MVFESLSDKLQEAFRKLRSRGKLSEADISLAMREVKLALLEADVNFMVVKSFVDSVSAKAVGEEVLSSLTPAQQVIKIVNEELTSLMGTGAKINLSPNPPTKIMVVGLQGSGKTTNLAKLALMFKKQGRNPMLAGCDVHRPAAMEQLGVLAESVGVAYCAPTDEKDAKEAARQALIAANQKGCDMIFFDTAGRLHIDQEMMDEIKGLKSVVEPDEILLVVDAMTGQDAVNIAKSFDEALEIDGIVLTKTDGDSRGGAALSVRAVTGKPIKFIGTGEKVEDMEAFHGDRMASRILGMGDVLTLIERAQEQVDEEKANKLAQKLMTDKFDLDDFLDQMRQMQNMGSFSSMLEMVPGMGKRMGSVEIDEKNLGQIRAIIESMTPRERSDPSILGSSRKKRIAAGSGTSVEMVNRLLKQFEATKKMMKSFKGMGKKKFMPGMGNFPF